MFFLSRIFCIVFLWFTAFSAQADLPSIDDFLGRDDLANPALSPNGKFVALARRTDQLNYISIVDLENVANQPVGMDLGKTYTRASWWLDNDRLLVHLGSYLDKSGRKIVSANEADEAGFGSSAPQRLVVIDRTTGTFEPILARGSRKRYFYDFNDVVSLLPGQPDHIAVSVFEKSGLNLVRLNTRTDARETIAEGYPDTVAWHVFFDGHPGFMITQNQGQSASKLYVNYASRGAKPVWNLLKKLRWIRGNDDPFLTDMRPLRPIDRTGFLMHHRPDEQDRAGLYRYDVSTRDLTGPLIGHAALDIAEMRFDPSSETLIGFVVDGEKSEFHFIDPGLKPHLAAVKKSFQPDETVTPLSVSEDRSRWLLHIAGPRNPGAFYLYDTLGKNLSKLGVTRQALANKKLAPTTVYSVTAPDGENITAFLTTPHEMGSTPAPVIVLPHSGPERHDVAGFNGDVQVLAAYGYQVLQVNYRGSSGRGQAFIEKGYGQWGLSMQQDVSAAVQALIKSGKAEASSFCSFGRHFGGYMALMASLETPEQFRCAIGSSGTFYDPSEALHWIKSAFGRRSQTFIYWERSVGSALPEAQAKDMSPVARRSDFQVPILLTYGKDHHFLAHDQTKLLLKALESVDADVSALRLPDTRGGYTPRKDALTEYQTVLAFLAHHIPTKRNTVELWAKKTD